MNKKRITEKGRSDLLQKLDELKNSKAPILLRLETARAFGDLKENAEYHEAKQSLHKLESDINKITETLENCVIINPSESDGIIQFGSLVKIINIESKNEHDYRIVGDMESDAEQGLLSEKSIMAQKMMGKTVSDSFEIENNRGIIKKYEIINVA